MKKIFTLVAMAMMTIAGNAQSDDLQFCYEDGTVIPNGSEVVINTPDPELLAEDEVKFESGIYVKNATASVVTATLQFDVFEMAEESELSVCLGMQCQLYSTPGEYSISNVNLEGGSISNMQCHWSPAINWDTEEYVYGSCAGKYTLMSGNTNCSTITVKFVYDDPAGIKTADKNATVVKAYDLQGRVAASANGIIIEKMSDGSVRKIMK